LALSRVPSSSSKAEKTCHYGEIKGVKKGQRISLITTKRIIRKKRKPTKMKTNAKKLPQAQRIPLLVETGMG